MTPILEIANLSYAYTPGQKILDGVDLKVPTGDYLGIIGPNGSGKTTFIKLILGLLPLQDGTVKIFGQPHEEFRDWKKIGYLPQAVFRGDQSFPATVREVVESGWYSESRLFSERGKRERQVFERVTDRVNIHALLDRRIGELSGGELQRVFIARALVSDPMLLIFDEPTSGVDLEGEETFYQLLRTLNEEQGITIVLISHDLEALAHNAKTALCLNRKVVYHGPAEGLHTESVVKSVFGTRAWHSIEHTPYGR